MTTCYRHNVSLFPTCVFLLLLSLSWLFCCIDALGINLNEPNVTFGAFDRNFTFPWPLGVGKAVFWYFWVAALATGKKRKKRDDGNYIEDEFEEFWNQNMQADLSAALQAYMTATEDAALKEEEQQKKERKEYYGSFYENENLVPESTEECMKKLACEVAAQDNLSQTEMDNFERLIGPHFIYLVEKEKLEVEEDEEEQENRLMVTSDCDSKYNCDLKKKLMLYLGSRIASRGQPKNQQEQ